MAHLPLLGQCVGVYASWQNNWQAAYGREGLQSCAASPGLRAPKVLRYSQLLAKCAGTTSSSYGVPVSLRLAKSTCFSFVSGEPVAETSPQVLLFRFSNIQHPMHLVSVLRVWISRAGCLAVLGFPSLPILTPFFLPGSGVGEPFRFHLAAACILPPLCDVEFSQM